MEDSSITTRSVLGDLRLRGPAWKILRNDEKKLREYLEFGKRESKVRGWSPVTYRTMLLEQQFSEWWCDAGGPVFELTHSIAALFAMTSAPSFEWRHSPHSAFVIKVPRDFFPLDGGTIPSADTWIFAAHHGALIVPDYDTTAVAFISFDEHVNEDVVAKSVVDIRPGSGQDKESISRACVLGTRFLANTLAYVTQHRKGVQSPTKKTPTGISVVRPPADVVISREFRDAARAAVSSRDLAGIRRALAHFVRGHWRNQAVGEGRTERRMTWVKPHKRGDESLGSVVSRIERLNT